MLRVSAAAVRRLTPEAEALARRFLDALPMAAQQLLTSVTMYGPHVRRYDPAEPFALLVVMDERSLAARAALTLATSAAAEGGRVEVEVTSATRDELSQGALARLVSAARRDGVVLWERAAG